MSLRWSSYRLRRKAPFCVKFAGGGVGRPKPNPFKIQRGCQGVSLVLGPARPHFVQTFYTGDTAQRPPSLGTAVVTDICNWNACSLKLPRTLPPFIWSGESAKACPEKLTVPVFLAPIPRPLLLWGSYS